MSGIITSISTRSIVRAWSPGGFLERLDRLAAVAGDLHRSPARFQNAGQGEDVAHVVLDNENSAAFEQGVPVPRLADHPLLFGGSSDTTWCRNSVTSSSSRSGDFAPLMMIDFE